MFAHDTFVAVFGAIRPGELDALAGVIRAALRAGYAVVLNEPGTKKPLCTLAAKARRDADREAQDAAAAAGEPGAAHRRHACGIHHALQGEDDAKKVTGLLSRLAKQYGGTPNIGIEPGRSRVVIVDMDTAGQRDAFLETWALEERSSTSQLEQGSPRGLETSSTVPDADTLYTVRSPGVQDEDGTWSHSDGGHAWFRLPDGLELPTPNGTGRGVLTDEGGWSIIWSGLQVLVPPSVRKEGPYAAVGMPRAAPAWLLQRIEADVLLREERERLRLERRSERVRDGDVDPVDVWSADTPWSELLEPDGWSPTGRVDTCSCPTWTAPGPHGSPKSATAHDEGCAIYDTDDGHAPLHVWTDNPPEYLAHAPRTLTRLTYVAHRDHEGSEPDAVRALGLAVGGAGEAAPAELDPFGWQDTGTPEGQDRDSTEPPGRQSEDEVPLLVGGSGNEVGSPAPGTAEEGEPPNEDPDRPADLFESAGEGAGTSGGDHPVLADDAGEPTPVVKDTPEPGLDGMGLTAVQAAAAVKLIETYPKEVRAEFVKLQVREQARQLLRAHGDADLEPPGSWALEDFLAQEFPGPKWLIENLWPAEGRVMLVAQYKAGKSTMVGNVLRALVDGVPFLGEAGADVFDTGTPRFSPVSWEAGTTAMLLDFELPPRTLQEWLADQGIGNRAAVRVQGMRGRAEQFVPTDDRRRTAWARYLREQNTRVLFLDPLAPIAAACGIEEDDNSGMAALTQAIDALAEEAGIGEVLLVHHMGHNGERSRGASRLRDWPDATWTLVREGEAGEEPPPNAARFFRALGRDVEVAESRLEFDPATRHLTLMGGTRSEYRAGSATQRIADRLRERPGSTLAELEAVAKVKKDGTAARLMDDMVARGAVAERTGAEVNKAGFEKPGGGRYAHNARVFFTAGDEP